MDCVALPDSGTVLEYGSTTRRTYERKHYEHIIMKHKQLPEYSDERTNIPCLRIVFLLLKLLRLDLHASQGRVAARVHRGLSL
jgi:hypothetical protein